MHRLHLTGLSGIMSLLNVAPCAGPAKTATVPLYRALLSFTANAALLRGTDVPVQNLIRFELGLMQNRSNDLLMSSLHGPHLHGHHSVATYRRFFNNQLT